MEHLSKKKRPQFWPQRHLGLILLLTFLILVIIFVVFYIILKNPAH